MICSWRLLERLRKTPNRNQRRTELFHSGAVRLKYEMQEYKSENSNFNPLQSAMKAVDLVFPTGTQKRRAGFIEMATIWRSMTLL